MNTPSVKTLNLREPNPVFWESEAYHKSLFANKRDDGFRYYDDLTVFRYLFFHWAAKWAFLVSKKCIEPYKFHPLPVSDQVLRWHPVFSKHISDGILMLERHEVYGSRSGPKPPKSILCRALFLTFWKRFVVFSLGLVITNVLSMSIAILVEMLIKILSDDSIKMPKAVGLLAAIVGFQILEGLIADNFNFYIQRLIYIVHYLFSMNLFKHSLCYRRKFYNNINGSNQLQVCNQVFHSCSPDSECSKNPFYCQAMSHQNKDISPKLFSYEWNDHYKFCMAFEAVKHIIEFATNFGYGIFLLSYKLKMKLWILYIVGLVFTFFMLFMEVLNVISSKFLYYMRDYKLTKCNDLFPFLPLIKKMLYDDIAINIITKARNNELSLILLGYFFFHFNNTLYVVCMNVTFYLIQRYFVKSVVDASVITDVDTASLMASFYIFLKIVHSFFLIPRALKNFGMAVVCFRRIDNLIKKCSANFYISDNKYTGSTSVGSVVTDTTNKIPKDSVVYYKDATFTWVHTRDDLLNKKYEPFLRNVDFELKRGQMAIVTGAQGSGKSNFIKSMLGEMTLVGGSMAVVPLHTSMPIFYASQDIFLQQGTIRSNIVFGYKFDQQLYNAVLKAVELEYDISTWDKGDLRVLSDRAHLLSGGQRVRMELARALYAYLIFHQVNSDYNNNKCSFLMCLDSLFQGLGPYVSKNIFNNLFNLKSGMLIKNDLSVVLTVSKQCLDLCSKTSDLTQIPNAPVYNINNQTLKFYSNLHDFVKNKKVDNMDYNYLSPNIGCCDIHFLTNDMLSLCSSGLVNKPVRMELTREKYSESFKSQSNDDVSGVKCNPYKAYLSPCLGFFVIYILIDVVLCVMDNTKYVLSTRLSDYISKHITEFKDGQFVDLSEIKTHSTFWFKIMTLFVSVIIVLSILSTILFSILSNITCRKIQEYVLQSIFKNSSSVIKLKKRADQIMTYLSCDTSCIDDDIGYVLLLFLKCSIQTITSIVTLFYLIPISIPFFIVAMSILYKFILVTFVNSAKNKHIAMLEAMSKVNSACENAISGSSIYRSYKNENSLVINIIEHSDYKTRTRFLYRTILTWCTIIFKYILSSATFIVLVLPIILDKYTKYKMTVGYFGLALSLCTNVIKSYSNLAFTYGCAQMLMGSIERFQYFIPAGQKLKFSKCINTNEEYVVNPSDKNVDFHDKKRMLKRREFEFKAENKKYYLLRRLFYHPKIQIVDADNYITTNHTGVELRDVCVYTTIDPNPESMILKHITVSSVKSEIIGIIGRTGAGKTTLLSVLQNIAENRTGQVLLDGKDLNDIPKFVLRQVIGVIPQLPFVFKGWTVRRFLDPRRLFSDEEINDALDKCGLDFVNTLPGSKRLETIIIPDGDLFYSQSSKNRSNLNKHAKESSEFNKPSYYRGTLLSNNQLRTLSLARLVLYKNFYKMIVVDEPPEEDLLYETYKKDDPEIRIYDILQKHFSHCTTFVTAHDVNALKTCTSVWVIHGGSLVKTCKTSDITANESIAKIIEECVKYSH